MWKYGISKMVVLKKAKRTLNRFKRDESGIAALSWAVSLSAIIAAMGAAMDFAILSGADQRSQTIADTTALAAAIYVKNYEQTPTNQAEGLIGEYTAKDLGYSYRNWVIDGSEGVNINVSYDDVNREATVLVSGQTRPTLMQILGYDALDFSAKSVVKYYEKDVQDPASVVLVLDNSGSMHFDDLPVDAHKNAPSDAQPRIDALKTSAKTFMAMLDDAVGPQVASTSTPRTLRTGMMAFDSNIISSRTIPMDWGVITDSEINAMTPQGATNSAPPMTQAKTWLNVTEPSFHEVENPGKTPLNI
jgi:Flp pilus assembly protein TadG